MDSDWKKESRVLDRSRIDRRRSQGVVDWPADHHGKERCVVTGRCVARADAAPARPAIRALKESGTRSRIKRRRGHWVDREGIDRCGRAHYAPGRPAIRTLEDSRVASRIR